MQFFIKPYSNIFIGSGKGFNKGEIYFGGGDFFLNPTVFYSIFKGSIRYIFFYKDDKGFLFPIPKDAFSFKKDDDNFLSTYKIKINNGKKILITNLEKKQKIKEVNGFIQENIFKGYLERGYINEGSYINYEEVIKTNISPNIEIDKSTRTTKEQMLTFKKVNEFEENIKIFVDVDIEDDTNKSYTLVGGETSVGLIEKIQSDEIIFRNRIKRNIKRKILETKYFKIILLTPTNYPPKIDGAELIAQLIGKPIAFSGWFNVYNEKSKEKIDSFPSRLFKLIPAGSVFYYELTDENKLDDIFDKYWLKPAFFVKEYPYFEKLEDETNPLGFGLSIIGVAQVEE
jgi:CRISPR-associated protein Cmr3